MIDRLALQGFACLRESGDLNPHYRALTARGSFRDELWRLLPFGRTTVGLTEVGNYLAGPLVKERLSLAV
jgi:hypothetical protein